MRNITHSFMINNQEKHAQYSTEHHRTKGIKAAIA